MLKTIDAAAMFSASAGFTDTKSSMCLTLTRRAVLTGATVAAGFANTGYAKARLPQTTWRFDSVTGFNQGKVHVEGQPQRVPTPLGAAIAFDGIDDALFVDSHPLAGAKTFTIEALIRPDGGATQQRWLHLNQDAPSVEHTRILFELRVVGDHWYLDAFAGGPGYTCTLADPQKLHPVGQWYHVAQSYDGTTYRAYVNRVVQAQADIAFAAQGPGHTSIATRINRVDYFKGALRRIRFSPYCLNPADFLNLV